MQLDKIRALRQALLDNAAGHPLAQVHRNNLFELLDECEAASIVGGDANGLVDLKYAYVQSEPEAPAIPRKIKTKKS